LHLSHDQSQQIVAQISRERLAFFSWNFGLLPNFIRPIPTVKISAKSVTSIEQRWSWFTWNASYIFNYWTRKLNKK
jgi:hypothetical protein